MRTEKVKETQLIIAKLSNCLCKLDKGTWEEFLCNRLVNLSGDMILLFERNHTTSIPIIWRAIFESWVNLLILLKEKEYAYLLEYQELDALKKIQQDEKRLKKWGIEPNLDALEYKKNRLEELASKIPSHLQLYTFEEKLRCLNSTAENFDRLYLLYRKMSSCDHGTIPYSDKEAADIALKCIESLPDILSYIYNRLNFLSP